MSKKRLYTLNEDFFSEIDNEIKAYWLGFIYADGNISIRKQGQNLLSIKLSIKDKEHLEKFIKDIQTNKPLEIRSEKTKYSDVTYCRIHIISNKIVNDLQNNGVTVKKSLSLKFPNNIKSDLLPHFIRGYFDGDGSVFIRNVKKYNKTYKFLGVSICGTKEFLEIFQNNLDFLKNSNTIFKDTRENNIDKNINSLKLYSNKRCKKFYEYLYENSSVFLERKKEIFDTFLKINYI